MKLDLLLTLCSLQQSTVFNECRIFTLCHFFTHKVLFRQWWYCAFVEKRTIIFVCLFVC